MSASVIRNSTCPSFITLITELPPRLSAHAQKIAARYLEDNEVS